MKTNNTTIRFSAALLSLLLLFCFAGCREKTPTELLWSDAIYTEDTALGSGQITISLTVTAGEKSVVLTLSSDKNNLAQILLENALVEGEDGPYGLYVKKVNGILADYDVDQSYWSLYIDGKRADCGVSGVTVTDGGHYELRREP